MKKKLKLEKARRNRIIADMKGRITRAKNRVAKHKSNGCEALAGLEAKAVENHEKILARFLDDTEEI